MLKIKRKALTDRFCARPEMTPGIRPRIIFLLVAPAATAEKDTRAVGERGKRSKMLPLRRQPLAIPEVHGSDAFIWIPSQAHIVSSVSRAAAPHQNKAQTQTSTGTARPGTPKLF